MTEHPYFLIGSERSGTTLLRLMLDHHPDIAFNTESEWLVSKLPKSGGWPEDMEAYRQFLYRDRSFKYSRFEVDPELSFTELVNDFLRQKMQRDNKPIIGATVHINFNLLPRIWPQAKYIYLLRDGRDVSRSVMQAGWAGNVWQAAEVWLEAEQDWQNMRHSLDNDQWIEIRFENLINNTRNELEKICQFMGTKFSERIFDYAQNTTYGLPDEKLAYQWKKKLNTRQLQLLEARIGERLEQRGYELSGLPIVSLSTLDKKLLRLDSRVRAFLYRVRKFGFSLVFREMIARRFNFVKWQRNLQRQLDAITDANLK